MSRASIRSRITSLPRNLETALHLLERGHSIRNGGRLGAPSGMLPEKVLDLFRRLEREKVEWVLVGAEAVNLHLHEPRSTVDVDIVVRKKHLRKVKAILEEVCGSVEDTEVHFKAVLSPEPNRLELDVIKSQAHVLFEEALDRRVLIKDIPTPAIEALLALKYFSAVGPWRTPRRKYMDVSDFIGCYHDNRSRIDRALLVELASKAHGKARAEFETFLHQVENDLPITL